MLMNDCIEKEEQGVYCILTAELCSLGQARAGPLRGCARPTCAFTIRDNDRVDAY